MADYQLPPWLGPVNPAPYFQQGVSQGASIAESQNRTELAIAEMTMRREAQQRAQDAQNLAAMRTVQDMQIAKQRQDEAARQAAIRWQGQQEYGSLVSQGMSPDEAFARTAHKIIPNQMGSILGQIATSKRAELDRAQREKYQTAVQDRFTETSRLREESAKRKLEIDPIQKQIDRLEGIRMNVQYNPTEEEKKPGMQGEKLLQIDRALDQERKKLAELVGKPKGVTVPKASEPSPYPEGMKIRNKRDGKLYEVRNGQPVLVE